MKLRTVIVEINDGNGDFKVAVLQVYNEYKEMWQDVPISTDTDDTECPYLEVDAK